MTQAQERWYVQRDGKDIAGPFADESEAFGWLLNHQGQSVHYATTHGGYAIVRYVNPSRVHATGDGFVTGIDA